MCESDGAAQWAPPSEQGSGRPLPTSQPAPPPFGRQQGRLQVSIRGTNEGSKGLLRYENGQSDAHPSVNSNSIVIYVSAGVPDLWHFTTDPDPRIRTFG